MKSTSLFLVLFVLIPLLSTGQPNWGVGDQVPRFDQYQTYLLMGGQFESWDSSLQTADLDREVDRHLRFRGYRPQDFGPGLQPDLLVFYSVFEGTFALPLLRQNGYEVQRPSTLRSRWPQLHDGSLLVTFMDSRSNRVVWTGFTVGLKTYEGAPRDWVLALAVQTVFDEFHSVARSQVLVQK